ncbi:hypothetical protein F4808DRAFT_458887 [Astrocystis sublimbata]|nr:hypothetical protein F4808DRAFT_458887 [Astrocystis sublimbata]
MAELVGLVASSFALAEVTIKAGDVKNVPETISDLMEQIDCFDPMLCEVESKFSQNQLPPEIWSNATAMRSLATCRKVVVKLSDIAGTLSTLVGSEKRARRAKGRMKVVLKKSELASLEQRLRTAVTMLQSAQMGYMTTLLQVQPDIIAEKMMSRFNDSHVMNAVSVNARSTSERAKNTSNQSGSRQLDEALKDHSKSDLVQFKSSSMTSPTSAKSKQHPPWEEVSPWGYFKIEKTSTGYAMKAQYPSWLASSIRVWSLNYTRILYSGWTHSFRTYNIRPIASPIFVAVMNNDVCQVQAMFQSGQGSPFDRDENGETLLHYASQYMAMKSYWFLNNMDLQLDGLNKWGHTPLDTFGRYYDDWGATAQSDIVTALSPLVAQARTLVLNDEELPRRCRCPLIADWSLFQLAQPFLCPMHREASLGSRLNYLHTIIEDSPVEVEQVEFFLGEEWVNNPDKVCNVCFGREDVFLIHVVAEAVSQLSRITWSKNAGFI